MKIAYFTHQYFPRHIGGTEVYLRGLAHRAVAQGHEILIFTYHESPSNQASDFGARRIKLDGIPVIEIHYNLGASPHPALYEYNNPFIAEIVRQELQSFAPDLVHAMHAMKLSGAVLESAYSLGIPVVVTLCDFWFICPRHTLLKWDGSLCEGPEHGLSCVECLRHTHGFARRGSLNLNRMFSRSNRRVFKTYFKDLVTIPRRFHYLKQSLLRANRIIALSAFQKKMFVKNGYPENRIEVCEHGVETGDLIKQERGCHDSVRLSFIGSLVSHKGAHVLIDALQLASDLKVNCAINSPVRETDPYTFKLLEAAKHDRRIHFPGGFAPHRLGEVLQSSDIFVMPALWYENEPLVVKAALHLGIPIIASNIGSLSEMLDHGKRGTLVKPGDSAELASALRSTVQDFEPGRHASSPAKSMDLHAEEMFSVYRQETKTTP